MNAFATALHEARHAVAALTLGFTVREVSVSGETGQCRWSSPTTAAIDDLMLVNLAGFSGDSAAYRSHSDVHTASAVYARWLRQHGPAAPFEVRVQAWVQEARLLLLPYAGTIHDLADALLVAGSLEQRALAALLPSRQRRGR